MPNLKVLMFYLIAARRVRGSATMFQNSVLSDPFSLSPASLAEERGTESQKHRTSAMRVRSGRVFSKQLVGEPWRTQAFKDRGS